MKDQVPIQCLADCEQRLEALGMMVERQIHAILLHMADQMSLRPAGSSTEQAPNVTSTAGYGDRREHARSLLALYSNRLAKKSISTATGTSAEMITYAQILDQALAGKQTLQ